MFSQRLSFLMVLIAVGSTFGNAQAQEQNKSVARSTQWFEGQIDEFIRNAQDNGEPTDIQVSTCKISSKQLVATAQATAARVLKGICNPGSNNTNYSKKEDFYSVYTNTFIKFTS